MTKAELEAEVARLQAELESANVTAEMYMDLFHDAWEQYENLCVKVMQPKPPRGKAGTTAAMMKATKKHAALRLIYKRYIDQGHEPVEARKRANDDTGKLYPPAYSKSSLSRLLKIK